MRWAATVLLGWCACAGEDVAPAPTATGRAPLVGPELALTPSLTSADRRPSAAAQANATLVAWRSVDGGDTTIRAMRVDSTGAALDAPVALSDPGATGDCDVTTGPNEWLVVWQQLDGGSTEVLSRRVAFDGRVVSAPAVVSFAGAADATLPRVAAGPAGYFAAWIRVTATTRGVRGLPVDLAGARLGSTLAQFSGTQAAAVDIASDGTQYVVAWSETLDGGDYDLFATRVKFDGGFVDQNPLPLVVAPADQLAPSLAIGGGQWLVVWYDMAGSAWARRFSLTGTALVPPLRLGDTNQPPFADWDGERFEVAFGNAGQLAVTKLWPDGGVEGPEVAGPGDQPGLAFRAPDAGLLFFNRVQSGAPRLFVRTLTDAPADSGVDSGIADAGTTDAGTIDAGTTDAGTIDAGTSPDLLAVGCGCTQVDGTGLLGLGALGVLVHRRRRSPWGYRVFHPPTSATSASASTGPQVPGS